MTESPVSSPDLPPSPARSVSLIERLGLAARHHLESARVALGDVYDFEFQEGYAVQAAAIHVGTAVELLSKAVVVNFDADLLWAPPWVFDRLRSGKVIPTYRKRGRSIDAIDALRFACDRHPSLKAMSGIRRVLDLRNAAAHEAKQPSMARVEAAVDDAEVFEKLVHGVLGDELAAHVGEARLAAWDAQVGAHLDELDRYTHEKVWSAREAYVHLTKVLSPDQTASWDEALATRSRASESPSEIAVRVSCPACEYPAADVISSSHDTGDDTGLGVLLIPAQLHCPRCGLRLDGDELATAGIDMAPSLQGD